MGLSFCYQKLSAVWQTTIPKKSMIYVKQSTQCIRTQGRRTWKQLFMSTVWFGTRQRLPWWGKFPLCAKILHPTEWSFWLTANNWTRTGFRWKSQLGKLCWRYVASIVFIYYLYVLFSLFVRLCLYVSYSYNIYTNNQCPCFIFYLCFKPSFLSSHLRKLCYTFKR